MTNGLKLFAACALDLIASRRSVAAGDARSHAKKHCAPPFSSVGAHGQSNLFQIAVCGACQMESGGEGGGQFLLQFQCDSITNLAWGGSGSKVANLYYNLNSNP